MNAPPTAESIAELGDAKTSTAPESQLDKWTQKALDAANLVKAARLIAERLELGDTGAELALTTVLQRAENEADELFGVIQAAAEAVGATRLGVVG